MTWRDRVVNGSYRGIPFILNVSEDEKSRRLIVHEFPNRDKPFIEDTGLAPTYINLEVSLIGDAYLEQRDSLQNACLKAGPGKLIHPHYGELLVSCKSVKTKHVNAELGIVTLSISFILSELNIPVLANVETVSKVYTSAQDVVQSQKTFFEKAFDYASLPYKQAQSVLNVINKAIEDIGKARAVIGQGPAFVQMLSNIFSAASLLVTDVGLLSAALIDLITFGFLTHDQDDDSTPDVLQSFKGLATLFEYTPTIGIQSSETDLVVQLVRNISIAQGGHLLSIAEFTSYDEAQEMKTVLFEAIETAQLTVGLDDVIFTNLQNLLAQVEKDLATRTFKLPKVVDITLPEFTPALILSHQLYGNVDSEQEILKRNRIKDPGLIPSDVVIKVLSNE